MNVDYAIIGGGISGVYSAWRLKQAHPEKTVVLFELGERIGGRLLSVPIEGIKGLKAELGGMRYLPEQHKLFSALVKELGLAIREFPMGSKDDPDGENNYAYFRGKHAKIKDLMDSEKMPYNLSWSEQGKSPDAIQAQLMRLLIPDWDKLSPDEWFDVEVFGKPLYQYGFWNLLYRVLSSDAYQFMKYGSGYDTNVSNGNSVVLLPTGGDYSSSNTYKTLVDGMEALPQKLAQQFESSYGGDIRYLHRLQAIRGQAGSYQLIFEKGSQKEREEVTASHVILAMPRHALEQIEWNGWQDAEVKTNLQSVLKQGAIKLFLAYPYAWWKELGLIAGRSISDIPIRQTFYFTAPDDMELVKDSKSPALLMASYSDIDTVPFWKGLESVDAADLYPGPKGWQTSAKMVEEAHRQVLELHGLKELPKPIAAAYVDWSEEPYGAAWHCWKPGYKFNEIITKMQQPIASENVYICGEAYSNDQGWAEGALETAEAMLQMNLQIPPHPITENWGSWLDNFMKRLSY